MRRCVLSYFIGLSLLLLVPRQAEACSCRPSGPPCEETWKSPLVFAGTVIAVEQKPGALGPHRVRFRITEAFRGTETGEIDIHLRGGGSPSCDPEFKAGESWLVYAGHRWEGGPGWTSSRCSRTRRLSDAAEDLAYLRLPDQDKGSSRIIGQIRHSKVEISGGTLRSELVPLQGVAVIVSDGDSQVETRTDHEGRYSVPAESYRPYTVKFGAVDPLLLLSGPSTVWVPHHRACVAVDAYAHYDGRLGGQVTDARGIPLPFFPVTLTSAPAVGTAGFEQHAVTDAAGRFHFERLNPASYRVSPSTSLWRGSFALAPLTPSPVSVGPSARVDTGILRMPESSRTTLVEIHLEDGEGKPAKDVYVYVKRPGSYDILFPTAETTTDEAGVFRVSLIAGRRYEIEARHTRYTPGGSINEMIETVIEATGLKPIRLRLAPAR